VPALPRLLDSLEDAGLSHCLEEVDDAGAADGLALEPRVNPIPHRPGAEALRARPDPCEEPRRREMAGVVSDLSLLRRMLPSSDLRVKVGSLAEFNRMRIRDAGVIEGVADCPMDSLLGVVAQMLVHFYAVLLTDDFGEVRGIITRADMLKLLCKNDS